MTHDQLVGLLRAYLDFWPWPETWGGRLERTSAEGKPAPFAQAVVCGTCEGTGRLKNKRVCHECKGYGRWNYDPYVGRLFPGMTFRTTETSLREREHVSQGDHLLDALASQHERRDTLLCYRQVGLAMDRLQPGLRALIVWTYVLTGQPVTVQSERGIDTLLELLPVSLHVPGEIRVAETNRLLALGRAKGSKADRKAQAARDAEIRRERGNGAKLHELAERWALNKSSVSRIVGR